MPIRLRRTALAVLAAIAAVLTVGVGTASAHVSVSSPNAAPGGFGEITFSVPSEGDTAKTQRAMKIVAEQLRLVWNARGAADVADLDASFAGASPSMKVIDQIIRALDR